MRFVTSLRELIGVFKDPVGFGFEPVVRRARSLLERARGVNPG